MISPEKVLLARAAKGVFSWFAVLAWALWPPALGACPEQQPPPRPFKHDEGHVRALSLEGKTLWALKTRGEVLPEMTLLEGHLFVATNEGLGENSRTFNPGSTGHLQSLDVKTGTVAWACEREASRLSQCWGSERTFYVAVGREGLLALDATSGSQRWARSPRERGGPLGLAGTTFLWGFGWDRNMNIQGATNHVAGFDPGTGKILSDTALRAPFPGGSVLAWAPLRGENGPGPLATRAVFLLLEDDTGRLQGAGRRPLRSRAASLTCLDVGTGTVIWERPLPYQNLYRADLIETSDGIGLVAGKTADQAPAGSHDLRTLLAMHRADTGKEVWAREQEGDGVPVSGTYLGKAYLGIASTQDPPGKLRLLSLSTGDVEWTLDLRDPAVEPRNGPDVNARGLRVRFAGMRGNYLLLHLFNDEMRCYDLRAKKLLWNRPDMVLGAAVPLLLEERLCFASVKAKVDADQEAVLYHVDLRSGTDLWSVSLGGAWRPGTFYESALTLRDSDSLILASWNPPPHH